MGLVIAHTWTGEVPWSKLDKGTGIKTAMSEQNSTDICEYLCTCAYVRSQEVVKRGGAENLMISQLIRGTSFYQSHPICLRGAVSAHYNFHRLPLGASDGKKRAKKTSKKVSVYGERRKKLRRPQTIARIPDMSLCDANLSKLSGCSAPGLNPNWWAWIPWNLSFRYIHCTGQFTPKMKAN